MNCPICKGSSKRYSYSENIPFSLFMPEEKWSLEIGCCSDCGFLFQSSAYGDSHYPALTEKLYKKYTMHTYTDFPRRDTIIVDAIDFLADTIAERPHAKVLEIGCGRGDFLFLLQEQYPNIAVTGCDPTDFNTAEVSIINKPFSQDLFKESFDIVVLRHVVEHILYPEQFIQMVKNIVSDSGVLFIEVPNISYAMNIGLDDFTPDHVNYFSTDSIISAMGGFQIIKQKEGRNIHTLFTKSDKTSVVKKEDATKHLDVFLEKRTKMIEIAKSYKTIIFYGVGNLYHWIYPLIHTPEKRVFFIDDSSESNEEPINRIRRADRQMIDRECLVILATSNETIIKKMKENLGNGYTVMVPWQELEYV